MKKEKDKLFVIKKYIKARSASEAIRKDKSTAVDDVWVDEDWKKGEASGISRSLGFLDK